MKGCPGGTSKVPRPGRSSTRSGRSRTPGTVRPSSPTPPGSRCPASCSGWRSSPIGCLPGHGTPSTTATPAPQRRERRETRPAGAGPLRRGDQHARARGPPSPTCLHDLAAQTLPPARVVVADQSVRGVSRRARCRLPVRGDPLARRPLGGPQRSGRAYGGRGRLPAVPERHEPDGTTTCWSGSARSMPGHDVAALTYLNPDGPRYRLAAGARTDRPRERLADHRARDGTEP